MKDAPTVFEIMTAMGMLYFAEKQCDLVMLEVGMGGRLDTTNVLERPAACVITSISMDHTRYLGDTLAKIAGEKAGIIKTGVPLIFDDGQPEVSTILEGFAFRKGAARYPVGRDDFYVEEIGEKGLSINARMKDGRCLELEIPFEAFYQALVNCNVNPNSAVSNESIVNQKNERGTSLASPIRFCGDPI